MGAAVDFQSAAAKAVAAGVGSGLDPVAALLVLLRAGAREADVLEVGVVNVFEGRGVHGFERHATLPTGAPDISR